MLGILALLIDVNVFGQCSSPITTFPIFANFEDGTGGGWYNDSYNDDFNWSLDSGGTPSGSTGPSLGYNNSTYYLYTESSSPNYPYKYANLLSPCFLPNAQSNISFAYHMYGSAMGSLTLQVSTNNGGSWTSLWSANGNKGNVWNAKNVSLSDYSGQNIQVRFRVYTSNSYTSDVALDDILISSQPIEICNDGIDNDGDLLIDDLDPDCGNICEFSCDANYRFDWSDGVDGAVWEITNGESSLTRVYEVSGDLGTYNVSVTLDNPYGQNIDFSNCGTPGGGSHFYTGTCNDPNANYDCDPTVDDFQFTYDCGYLTFGITSDNSNQYTSITYDFDFPAQMCDLQIGDIDYQGSGSGSLPSWQDEVEIIASNDGIPVAINAKYGSSITAINNNSENLILISVFDDTSNGNLDHNDPAGHAYITTLDKITSLTFKYSNGPDDDGASNDHAIRVNGFDFCPVEKYELCENGIDDDDDGLVDCEDDDCGFITNREFDEGVTGWQLDNYAGASSTFTIDNTTQISGANSAFIDMTNATGTDWNTQLMQYGHTLESGKVYEVIFNAKSVSSNKDVTVVLQEHTSPYTTYFSKSVTVSPTMQEFKYQFLSSSNNTGNVRYSFLLAGDNTDIYIDRVQLKEVCPVLVAYNTGNVCIGAYADLLYTAPNLVTSLTWTGPNGFTSTEPNPSFLVTDASQGGDYILTVTYPDATQEISTTTLTVDTDCSDICLNQVPVFPTNPTSCAATDGQIYVTDYNANTYEHSIDGVNWNPTQYTYSGLGVGEYLIRIREIGDDNVCRSVKIILENTTNIWYTGETVISASGCESNDGSIELEGVISTDLVSWIELDGVQNFVAVSTLSPTNTISNLKPGQYYVTVLRDNNIYCFTERIVEVPNSGIDCPEIELCEEASINYFPDGDFGSGAYTNGAPLSITETSYSYSTMNCGSPNDGFYAIVNNTNCNGSGGQVFGTWDVLTEDHTEGDANGYMLLVNASFKKDIAIEREVTGLATNTFYTFSAWVYNIVPSEDLLPNLTFLVDGVGEYTTGPITESGWQRVGFPFYTGSSTSFRLAIRNNQTGGDGNDWLLDDIRVSLCKASIEVMDVEVCEGETVTLEANVSDPAEQFSTYMWQKYNASLSSWEDITGMQTGTYSSTLMSVNYEVTTNATTALNGDQYRIIVTNDPLNINNSELSTTSETIGITVRNRPEVTLNSPSIDCLSGATVQIFSSVTGGTAPFLYNWDGPSSFTSNLENPTVTESGNYFVTLTDANGCTAEANTTVGFSTFSASAGPDVTICSGELQDLTASGGNTYAWNNGATASVISVSPTMTSTFTVTISDESGCSVIDEVVVNVLDSPTATISGPSEICVGFVSNLTANTTGTWVSTNPSVASVNGSGVVSGLSAGTTTFIFEDDVTLCQSDPTLPFTVKPLPIVTVTGPTSICEGETTTLAPTTGGTWVSSNTSVATVQNHGTVTAVGPGLATFTFQNTTTDCVSSATTAITIKEQPVVNVLGSAEICLGETTQLSSTLSGGYWTSNDPTIATISSSGVVTGISAGSTTFYYTSAGNCISTNSASVTISPGLSVAVDFNGNECITTGSTLSADVTGGTPNFTYEWSGPNGFSETMETVSISESGNYSLTVTDDFGCTAETSGFVYSEFVPFIFSLNTEVCEGENIDLSINGSNIIGYAWDTNAGDATTQLVNVTPAYPSSTYVVTVTNSQGCTSTASATIDVNQITTVAVTGSNSICIDETSTLSPSTGGQWVSTNPAIASVTETGVVTGVAAGSTTFVFIDEVTDCSSIPTTPIVIKPQTPVMVTGPNTLCEGFTTNLSPTTGGSWLSNDSGVATVTDDGVVSAVGPGTVTFNFVSDATNCTSDDTEIVTIYPNPIIEITGNDTICLGSTTTLTSTINGTWTSDNSSVATIDALGLVTGVGQGIATFTFESENSCVPSGSLQVVVENQSGVGISGDNILCEGETTTLSATVGGGIWGSNNTTVATIDQFGLITAIGVGSALITYVHPSNSCSSDATFSIGVYGTPVVSILGDDDICMGETTQLSTTIAGGFWSSNDPTIAIVGSTGLVTGIGQGSTTFYYTTSQGCVSEETGVITIRPAVDVTIDFNGSQCLLPGSSLSAILSGGTANYTFEWFGPGGFTASTQTVNISLDGNYTVNITDANGCTATATAFIYESYAPSIFALNTTVCEGESVTLSVNGSNVGGYQWGANAGSSTNQSVTVTPNGPSTTYSVTVTNLAGCAVEATAELTVNAEPAISYLGSSDICVGTTTQLTSGSNGTWTSSNSTVASIDNNGLVTGNSAGTATFTFQDGVSGCYSEASAPVSVDANSPVSITGSPTLCFGDILTLSASVPNGTWTSSNTAIATINALGEVTPLAPGVVFIEFEPSSSNCFNVGSFELEIFSNPIVALNGPSTICQDDVTYANSSTSGSWTSSDLSVATISEFGVITGIGQGNATITFQSVFGCTATLFNEITVIGKTDVSLLGSPSVCINGTTSLSPSFGGIWISSNANVATVSSNGIVTGINPGTTTFTFIEASNGCVSDETITITVDGKPIISGLDDNELCIGETTSIYPSTGGEWASTNEAVATISDEGVITAVGPGSARFTYTNLSTSCTSNLSLPLAVNSKPNIGFLGPVSICVGETTSISPTTGGQWTSTDVSIATINAQGIITGVNPGNVAFIFTNSTTGCSSDASEFLTIEAPTTITLSGDDRLCIGETTNFLPSSGGVWTSSNTNIATIDNFGLVTAMAPGIVNFTFDSFVGCTSNSSIDIIIDPEPIVSYAGSTEICEGFTTNLSPSSGGTWSSSDTTIATVDDTGLVTAVGFGAVDFTFVDESTGCGTTTESSLTIFARPVTNIVGDDEICIGSSTFLLPNTGGVWTSSNPTIATISSNGQVTGISPGTASFTFFETGSTCISEASAPVTVLAKASVSITSDNTICVGEMSTASPTTGGSWVSDDTEVATIDDSGNITGVGQGIARFTFISNAGCASNKTTPVIVFGPPSVSVSGPISICINGSTQLLPISGGTWYSSSDSIATITNDGVVTGHAEGIAYFTFVDSNTGCSSEATEDITINPVPDVGVNGPSEVCIGGTTNLTPSSGGIWTSVNPEIASIENNGLVTGVSVGQARFIFTNLDSGCSSDTSDYIVVNSGSIVEYVGSTEICIGDTTYLTPNTGGTWTSSNPNVASISNEGLVIGLNSGTTTFQFTELSTGCLSSISEPLTVNGPPTVGLSGSSLICIGSSTQLNPNTGGSWESLNESIATVTTDGLVTGVAEGLAYFIFTDGNTGCKSDGLLNVTVSASIEAQVTGGDVICAGYTTTLSPTTGGVWTSSNPEIATVSNFGVVTGRAPGVVTFNFVDANTGCSAGGTTDPVTIEDCLRNDFNVALVDQLISGNLNTNDNGLIGAEYSNINITLEKPLASLPQLTISPDGSYTFETNKPGKYLYKISACIPPLLSGCPGAILELNVLEDVYGTSNPVSNLEFITTYANADELLEGNPVIIDPMANDKCVYTVGCDIDSSSVSVITEPSHGTTSISAEGKITYTPEAGFIGYDTIHYSVCVEGEASNCSSSSQVVTVNHTSAVNGIDAADDFTFTLKETLVQGNLMNNDSDAEGHGLSVDPQGSFMAPIITADGEFYIESDGNYSFTPNSDFSGATEIIYTVCDDNAISACSNATLHIQVFDDLSVPVRVYLEGALSNNNNEVGSDGEPLMRDNLRLNPYDGSNCIPLKDPYSYSSGFFDNTPSKFIKVGPGLLVSNHVIIDSTTVFTTTGEDAIVDWMFVEIRDKNDYTNTLATRAGLLQRDGDVVDLDGYSTLRFEGLNVDSFYVVVKHRNHLGAMSLLVANGSVVDFTLASTPLFNFGTSLENGTDYTGLSVKSNYKDGFNVLWAGDMNSDGKIKFTEPASDQNVLFGDVLFSSPDFLINYDNSIGYYRGDFNLNGKAKYTNPNDDKNLLFTQLLLYPLNTSFIANYGNLVEQVP